MQEDFHGGEGDERLGLTSPSPPWKSSCISFIEVLPVEQDDVAKREAKSWFEGTNH